LPFITPWPPAFSAGIWVRGLVTAAYPLPQTTDADLVETLEKRQALQVLLGLNATTNAVVKTGAAIASPFIGSVIGLLIPD
jgi:hypothetical protein